MDDAALRGCRDTSVKESASAWRADPRLTGREEVRRLNPPQGVETPYGAGGNE
jgi:hypothetical protein